MPAGILLQGHTKIRHVQWTLIGAVGMSEKQERDVSSGFLPEIKRSTDGVGENKSNLGFGRGGVLISPGVPYSVPPCMRVYCSQSEARGYGFPSQAVFPHPAALLVIVIVWKLLLGYTEQDN